MKKICFDVMVAGAGGTGSYFLKEISRFLASNTDALRKIHSLYICDGDSVEKKNLSRQCFTEEDIGRKKAVVMAEILSEAYSLNWNAYPHYLTSIRELKNIMVHRADISKIIVPVIIGCVDNHGARLLFEKYFDMQPSCIYFDSANEFASGETVFSYKMEKHVYGPCRSTYFPDILKGDTRNVTDISCEELNKVEPQHILTNMSSGLQLLSAFTNLLDGKMTPGVTYFNPFKMYTEFIPYQQKERDVAG